MSFTAVDPDTALALSDSLIHLYELFDDYYRDPALKANRALLPSPDVIFDFCVQHRLIEAPFSRVYRHLRDEYRSISGARDVIEKWCAGQTTANTPSPINAYRKTPVPRRPKLLFGERRPKFKTRKRAKKPITPSSAASATTSSAPSPMSSRYSSLLAPHPSVPIDDAISIQRYAEPTPERSFTSAKLAEGGTTIVGEATGVAKENDYPVEDTTFLFLKPTGRDQTGAKDVVSLVQDSKQDAD